MTIFERAIVFKELERIATAQKLLAIQLRELQAMFDNEIRRQKEETNRVFDHV